ncbi:hypothetical protein DFJ74DRAFT_334784 [Hyaloraphidium curvatum]|nr:hypothetical protein DFJ74DRAFT_334784 [Hyaloraphidium curvatum]
MESESTAMESFGGTVQQPLPRLSEKELLALLPAPTPHGIPPPWVAAGGAIDSEEEEDDDLAASARRVSPLTPKAMLDSLATHPGLRAIAWVAIKLEPYGKYVFLHWIAWCLVFFPVLAVCWVYGGDLFGTRQLAFATAARTLEVFLIGLVFIGSGFQLQNLETTNGGMKRRRDEEKGISGNDVEPPVMDDDLLAPVARWLQLVAASDAAGAQNGDDVPPLIAHVDRDPYCPCSRPSCLGPLPRRFSIAFVAFFSLFSLPAAITMYTILGAYSALFTLAADTWTHAWSAIVCVIFILVQSSYYCVAQLILLRNNSIVRLVSLDTRVQIRAFRIALGSLMARFRAAEKRGVDIPPESLPSPADTELYITVYRSLSPTWRHQKGHDGVTQAITIGLLFAHCIVPFVYVAGGSCLPAYNIVCIGYFVCQTLFQLVGLARSNAKQDAVAGLFRQARDELRMLALRLGPEGCPPLKARANDTVAVLTTMLEGAEGSRATFLRAPVSMALIRTLAATMLTVTFAAFGLLRAAGVYVTVQSVCWPTA